MSEPKLTPDEFKCVGEKLREKVRFKGTCVEFGCDYPVIEGHFYSKGILNSISDKRGMVKLFEHNRYGGTVMKKFIDCGVKYGIANTFSGSLRYFCGKHDHQVFKSIEEFTEEINFRDKTLCNLMSLKAVLKEYHNVYAWVELYREYKTGDVCEQKVFSKMGWESKLDEFEDKRTLLINETRKLKSDEGSYNYAIFRFNRNIGLYINTIFQVLNTKWVTEGEFQQYYIHVIPFEASTILIVGGEFPILSVIDFMSEFCGMSFIETLLPCLGKTIVDIKAGKMERVILNFINFVIFKSNKSFCCSLKFYEENIKYRERQIIEEMERVYKNYEVPKLNIFSN